MTTKQAYRELTKEYILVIGHRNISSKIIKKILDDTVDCKQIPNVGVGIQIQYLLCELNTQIQLG